MGERAMPDYPYVIDNGAGERLAFDRRFATPDGDRVEGENVVAPGAGPPMHVHHLQDEGLTVLQGRLGYRRLGGGEEFAGEGETVVFPAGEAHRFWNAGEGELRCRGYMTPAGNTEYFLAALFESQKRAGGSRPSLFDVAFLLRRYRSEFAMLEIPPVVQRFLFPPVVALGRILGRYARYADAPEPLQADPPRA